MSELARRYAQALWQVSPDGEALERTARALMEEPALWEALARRGGARCVLTCVRPLEAEELEKLRAALCRLHHKKEIVFDVRTDPALLGGFTLDIEGVRYDKSVRGALGRMGRQLEERRMA